MRKDIAEHVRAVLEATIMDDFPLGDVGELRGWEVTLDTARGLFVFELKINGDLFSKAYIPRRELVRDFRADPARVVDILLTTLTVDRYDLDD
jgi:hypothetical protein